MPKNIIILSHGTGQQGGIKPDQNLSNIYKLFRAARTGPDSIIDPKHQIAYYDAGLGTEPDQGSIPLLTIQAFRQMWSGATGSVATRVALTGGVLHYGRRSEYRPPNLTNHGQLAQFYSPGALSIPANEVVSTAGPPTTPSGDVA